MSVLRQGARRRLAVTTVTSAVLLTTLVTLPLTQAAQGAPAAPAAPAAAAAPDGPLGVASTGTVAGLTIQNSFVSSVGWVKPGESYPSRILLTNTTDLPITGAIVRITAPVGSRFVSASDGATVSEDGKSVLWTAGPVAAKVTRSLVLESEAATTAELPTVVWRDISSTAVLTIGAASSTVTSHGPKVIPPDERFDTARYGDRPFAVVPVEYTDRDYLESHDGGDLAKVINDPATPGSTFNLFQEMSLGQLYPQGTVPSAGKATADFAYPAGFPFTGIEPGQTCTGGATFGDSPIPAQGTPAYPERIRNGVYNLPGNTAYYGADANGSAVVGAVGGVAALQQIDSGCGPTGKMVWDAAAIADPEIDYSDYDTDKDGVVDFFMVVFAGCGGNGASQLGACTDDPQDVAPYDNVWPHSSSLEYYYTDDATGLPGFTTDDQLKDLEGRPLWYTDTKRTEMTTVDKGDALKVFVRVGPYNVNPETAIDKASVISHEYGHSLGLPDFYSLGGRETYGDWNLMATDKSQHMDAYSRQELGWVVPEVLAPGSTKTVTGFTDSKQNTGTITWQTPDGTPYTLSDGPDGVVRNSQMYVAKLPGRQLLDPAKFDTGDKASKTHAWFSGSGNDFGCASDGNGHNLDFSIPGLKDLPAGSTVKLTMKSMWDIEWDYDYGYVLTSKNGGDTFVSNASEKGYTTTNAGVPGNPNQNACQATYDNGLTGTSGSYNDGTQTVDRVAGEYPESVFLADSFDISDLVGAATPVVRLSYATDPGLARPGWFIDDLKVTATTPSGEKVLFESDFEKSGGPDDPFVFNGGCKADNPGGRCTKGWNYVAAGDEADFDHAYYLEMRDRSGFDLDGRGQIDRDPIGFEAGLYLAYTDEAHGYGNAGTDDPPAQSPLDSKPQPGNDTPNLNDAAFTAATGRSTYSDGGAGHIDNYSDPSNPAAGNPWLFKYNCLGFTVQSMSGNANGPATADGDLTGNVAFTLGTGCGDYDYGYGPAPTPDNTAPDAVVSAPQRDVAVGEKVTFDARDSTDAEDPDSLQYSWDFDDGGETKDATGQVVKHAFDAPGTYDVKLTVTDPDGLVDTATTRVTVTDNGSAPRAKISVTPDNPFTTTEVRLSGRGSSDAETADKDLTYAWNFGNGGKKVDATGKNVRATFKKPGFRTVRLTVTDEAGNSSTAREKILVRRYVACQSPKVVLDGSWRTHRGDSRGGNYCDNLGRGPGPDTVTYAFRGTRLVVVHGESVRGGVAQVFIDGDRKANLSFRNRSQQVSVDDKRLFRGLGSGEHTVRIVVQRGEAYLDGFIVRR